MRDAEWKCKHGDVDIALTNLFAQVLVGSTTHGLAVGGDDRDYIGVCIEPPDHVTGLHHFHTAVLRTQPEGRRSGPGDIDLTIYSLRHLMRLLRAGNPTILILLFVKPEAVENYPLGDAEHLFNEMQQLRQHIVSKQALQRFLGYLDKQLERLQGGGKRNRVPNRPELIEQYGYDTKYAMHALRLGLQGLELAETGKLSLPMDDDDRHMCLRVRNGLMSLEDAIDLIQMTRSMLVDIIDNDKSVLPNAPNDTAINSWLHRAHNVWWRGSIL